MAENIMLNKHRKIGRILEVLKDQIIHERAPVTDITWMPCDYKKGNEHPPIDDMKPFPVGALWGEQEDGHAWFHMNVTAPPSFAGFRTELGLMNGWDGWNAANPQFIAYINGAMRQGLDTYHRTCVLDEGENDIWLYAYTGPQHSRLGLCAELRAIDPHVEALYYNIRVPFESLAAIHPNTKEYMTLVEACDKAILHLDLLKIPSEAFSVSVKEANRWMETEFYGKTCKPSDVTTVSIGHTHIDCAWHWTLQQTREKVQRSFSTVLELMRRYPDYKFMSSQALLYQDLKEEAPEVYEEVRRRVKEGRWEVEGAMWVEADCNLSSGESLVRQVMYGKRFFREEFGVETKVLWLPDVFGYSAALPQILKKSGVEWFLTSKISWNERNMMPYDVFSWRGIDGTSLPAYFLTAQHKGETADITQRYSTYNGGNEPSMIAGTWNRFQQKDLTNEALLVFGHGDGGGGPTPEMLEQMAREKHGIPGIPAVTCEFAGDFLRRLEKKIRHNPALPTWQGELYLEFHRGTYTSQAKNKKNNRECELLYQNTEFLTEMGRVLLGRDYPAADLHFGWETILTNQFHDIIPGSSIHAVYEQCDKDYARIRALAEGHRDAALVEIARRVRSDGDVIVFNPHSFPNSGCIRYEGKTYYAKNVPAKGWCTARLADMEGCLVQIRDRVVNTPHFRVKFDKSYQLSSVYDKKNHREVLKGTGNVLEIYEDFPYNYDAWEVSLYHKDKILPLTQVERVEEVEDGVRCGLRITRRHLDSTITQTVWFYSHIGKIDFETDVDWHQTHQLLKCAFPVDVYSDKASYEIQFGSVERPTHSNTSWDAMKFEVCGHKYADLSDAGYGVSLLNDCKYGYDIHDGIMRLSLIKCATNPDPLADQGSHRFTYSLYPHAGALKDGDTLPLAYDLNLPMQVLPVGQGDGSLPERYSFLQIDKADVIAETVKRAEDSNDTVVRLYEAKNMHARTKITFGFPVDKVYLCDLEEKVLSQVKVTNNSITLSVRPFEIVTLKITAK